MHELAYKDYLAGFTQKEIAIKYNVSTSAVKSWKSRHWNKKVAEDRKGCSKSATNKKKLPLKDAENTGVAVEVATKPVKPKTDALLNKKNVINHGIYEKIKYKNLSQDEIDLLDDTGFDEITELRKLVRVYDLEIIRLNKLLDAESNNSDGMSIASFSNREMKYKGKKHTNETITTTVATSEVVIRIMDALSRFYRLKTSCIETIYKLEVYKRVEEANKPPETTKEKVVVEQFPEEVVLEIANKFL